MSRPALDVAADFPLEAPNTMPGDELAHAMSLLNLIGMAFEDVGPAGIDRQTARDMFAALCAARNAVKPVTRFLDKMDWSGEAELFRQCRRDLIREAQHAAL